MRRTVQTTPDASTAHATVHAAFAAVAERRGDAPFLVIEGATAASYGIEAGERSWREVAGEVERLRGLYAQAGYGHGHRVGLLLENRPAFFTHWLALNALGASIVPIPADIASDDCIRLIAQSEMGLAVAQPGREHDLRQAGTQAGVQLQTMRPEALGQIPRARTAPPAADRLPGRESECAVLHTAGTTGRPKGCRLSNGYFLRAGAWLLGLGGRAALRPDVERFVTPLPLGHARALAFPAMAAILSGGAIVPLDRFDPKTWWKSVRDARATVVHPFAAMPGVLLDIPADARDREHGVRFGFGFGVDPRHHAAFEARFGFPLVEAWTTTETGPAACTAANREPRHVGTRCVGRATSSVDTRLVDAKGADVGVDVRGELLVRAPGKESRTGFFLGYLKDEAATEEAWADGWFHTGDMLRRGEDGQLHFVDRRQNLIRRSAESISSLEVESVLNLHPAVAASAVAPTPDPKRGEEVLAFVALRPAPNTPPLEQVAASIVRHALERVLSFEAPGFVAFVDALPMTAANEIRRAELRDAARTLPGQAHCFDMRNLKRRKRALDAAASATVGLDTATGGFGTGVDGLSPPER